MGKRLDMIISRDVKPPYRVIQIAQKWGGQAGSPEYEELKKELNDLIVDSVTEVARRIERKAAHILTD